MPDWQAELVAERGLFCYHRGEVMTMKLNERLFELRRKAGLSQEELADKIGVSRQAVGKWENGISVPELDKLMALSEFYQMSIGELLGVESQEAATAEPSTETPAAVFDTGELEELLRELGEQQKRTELRTKKQRKTLWCVLGAAAAAIVVVAVVFGSRMADLKRQMSNLNSLIIFTQHSLNESIASMRGTIAGILEEQNSLFSDWDSETVAFDPERREVTVRLFAQPKSVTEGLRLDFVVTDEEGRELQTEAIRQGTGFAAEIRLPQSARELPLEAFFAEKYGIMSSVSSQVEAMEPLNGEFTLAAVLTEGDTAVREKLGTFYAGVSELAGDFLAAWYADPTAEEGTAGLLAVYADAGRAIVSAELATFVNGVEWARTSLDMSRDEDWVTEFDMPEKYAAPRKDGNTVASVPGKLTASEAYRLFVRELAPDVPESREGETVSVLLELTDDQNITYAALILITTAWGRPQNTFADMTPILK